MLQILIHLTRGLETEWLRSPTAGIGRNLVYCVSSGNLETNIRPRVPLHAQGQPSLGRQQEPSFGHGVLAKVHRGRNAWMRSRSIVDLTSNQSLETTGRSQEPRRGCGQQFQPLNRPYKVGSFTHTSLSLCSGGLAPGRNFPSHLSVRMQSTNLPCCHENSLLSNFQLSLLVVSRSDEPTHGSDDATLCYSMFHLLTRERLS